MKSTKSQDIIDVISKIALAKRKAVKEITVDMLNNMQSASRMWFPESYLATDWLDVFKLVIEVMQQLRINIRTPKKKDKYFYNLLLRKHGIISFLNKN